MNYLKGLKKRESLAMTGIAVLSFIMMLVFAGMLIKSENDKGTGINYTYTGTDMYYGGEGMSNQYYIKYIKDDNGDMMQVIFEASSVEEVGEIKRYIRNGGEYETTR